MCRSVAPAATAILGINWEAERPQNCGGLGTDGKQLKLVGGLMAETHLLPLCLLGLL